jgi:hypothetical protein
MQIAILNPEFPGKTFFNIKVLVIPFPGVEVTINIRQVLKSVSRPKIGLGRWTFVERGIKKNVVTCGV